MSLTRRRPKPWYQAANHDVAESSVVTLRRTGLSRYHGSVVVTLVSLLVPQAQLPIVTQVSI